MTTTHPDAAALAAPHVTFAARTVETPAGRTLRALPPVFVLGHAESGSRAGVAHTLTGTAEGGRGCSCEAFRFRPERGPCKHLRALAAYALRGELPLGVALTAEGFVALGLVR